MNSVGSIIAQAKAHGSTHSAGSTSAFLAGAVTRRTFSLLVMAAAPIVVGPRLASGASAPVQTVTVIVRPEGLMPRVVKIKAGLYSIGVFNRSGIDELRFELDRLPGRVVDAPATERLAFGVAPKRTARWFQRLNATRGYYRLRVVERPTWTCLIEVE